ncbi:nitroreductase family protein [Chloroflexota bacterium]
MKTKLEIMEYNMLTVSETIEARRSIRKYSSDDVPDEVIRQLLEAARLAPSASNRQPWCFLIVKDKALKTELCRICLGQRFIEEAPVVIVCFGNMERYSLEARRKRGQEFVDSGVLATLSGSFADPAYRKYLESLPVPPREELYTALVANTYIAIEHIVLMAISLGLGTCWVGGFSDASEINRLFDLADTLVPVAVVPLGYPAGEPPPQRPRLKLEEIILIPHKVAA